MGKLFGTDGVRGIPGQYPLVGDVVRRLGYVAARYLLERRAASLQLNGAPPLVLIGRDSRASGASLAKYLAQGFGAAGCHVIDLGIIPTPGVAYLVPRRKALFGAVISASHNPAEFNGIKFITSDGFKMSPEFEDEIERRLEACGRIAKTAPKVQEGKAEAAEYVDFLRSTLAPSLDLSRLRLVVDCAHGAACAIAPKLLRSLGATVVAIGCSPNGKNINQGCGALETDALKREVVRRKYDLGISLDGDADRAIFCDADGHVCDGDTLLSIAATHMLESGRLNKSKVVLTVMSNYGMIQFLRKHGIDSVVVPVGDRNVTEAIEKEGLSLGGEASGHIVFRRFSPTGDGMLTALQILAVLAETGKDLRFYRKRYDTYPQLLTNVRVQHRVPLEHLPHTSRLIRSFERQLKGKGRVFVRYSGTEPLIRILVEGPDRGKIKKISQAIVEQFKEETAGLETGDRA